jgi:serine/threonine protein kinase
VLWDSKNKNLKLIDFGLSKLLKKSTDKMNTYCGSPAYMAPKVFLENCYTVKADLWSLGVMTYLMLSGEFPFFSDSLPELTKLITTCDFNYD